jgi:hypothetical protein
VTTRRPQVRNSCNHCGAEWWHWPGGQIHPRDHQRPDGRRCLKAEAERAQARLTAHIERCAKCDKGQPCPIGAATIRELRAIERGAAP